MKAMQKTFLSLATALLLGAPALASDIILKAGPEASQITLTSNLPKTVYLTALFSATEYIPMNMQLGVGETGTAKFTGALPASLQARGLAEGGQLAGHTPAPEGYFELSVSIE